MPAQCLDGAAVARAIRAEVAREVADLKATTGRAPRLAAVLVGDDPASQVYVRNKVAACAEVGIRSDEVRLEAAIPQDRLVGRIERLNEDPDIDGILVQLPLPRGLDRVAVLLRLDPGKDVDGLHPLNAGRLLMRLDAPVPCTPAGIIDLLERNRLPVAGRHAVVATVTVCHSKTPDLASFTVQADLLIAAIGRPAFLRGEHIKRGATVIDVGVNRLEDTRAAASIFGSDSPRVRQVRERGYALVGDVHPVEAAERAAFLTPVPGGVGPLTIACLLRNTLRAARVRRQRAVR